MIVTKVPLRISLAGGGTDLPSYYVDRGVGETVSFAINKYIYITSSDYYDTRKTNFKYSEVETVECLDHFKNPIVRQVLKLFSVPHGLQFASLSSVPGGTGLGSSSAFCVGLVSNVAKRMGRDLSQYEAAEIACYVELELLKEPIGKQDQFGCALGGMKHLTFTKLGVFSEGLLLSKDMEVDFSTRLALVRVGGVRSASQILSEIQKENSVNLSKLDDIRSLVPKVKSALLNGDIEFIGESLHKNWIIKKSLDKNMTDENIDYIYEKMVPKMAFGGKLLGAGGSGFLLFILKQPVDETVFPPDVIVSNIEIDKAGVVSVSV
ncbi:hypothetical protein N9565_00680 [Amylibacter sp.]|nr:hypothetical protein [Amylibacter sp.]